MRRQSLCMRKQCLCTWRQPLCKYELFGVEFNIWREMATNRQLDNKVVAECSGDKLLKTRG